MMTFYSSAKRKTNERRLWSASSLVGILIICIAFAAAGQEVCRVVDPDLQGTYEGGCLNGLAEGKGTAQGRDSYTGEFRRGEPHGKGVYKWGARTIWDGDKYEGEFFDGKRVVGEYEYHWGLKQIGNFRGNLLHGIGTEIVPTDSLQGRAHLEERGISGGDGGSPVIIRGLFDGGALVTRCDNEPTCEKASVEQKINEGLICLNVSAAHNAVRKTSSLGVVELYLRASASLGSSISFAEFQSISRSKQEEIAREGWTLYALRQINLKYRVPRLYAVAFERASADAGTAMSGKRALEVWAALCDDRRQTAP